jgi:hypothetical protein
VFRLYVLVTPRISDAIVYSALWQTRETRPSHTYYWTLRLRIVTFFTVYGVSLIGRCIAACDFRMAALFVTSFRGTPVLAVEVKKLSSHIKCGNLERIRMQTVMSTQALEA